jgi:hypothetical protein
MTGFTALNLEPEDDAVEEIDETREIQLEEALKLYQNALRLHSLGPEYQHQAADAYKELFNSEIFRYPEAVSDFTRDELDSGVGETVASDSTLSQLDVVPPVSSIQVSPSSLPQIIYLSFKNYGQFLLDQHAQDYVHHETTSDVHRSHESRDLLLVCSKALKQFAEALERDDTDLDLWRKAAKVAHICFSDRIVRFCLESVLAGDDEGANEVVEILGLEEALAAGQLRDVIDRLQDDLSLAQNSNNEPRKDLLELLKNAIDPFPFLPDQSYGRQSPHLEGRAPGYLPKRHVVRSMTSSWHEVGQALLQNLNDEQQFKSDPGPGAALYLDVPPNVVSSESAYVSDRHESCGANLYPSKTTIGDNPRRHIEMPVNAFEALVDGVSPHVEIEDVKESGRNLFQYSATCDVLSPLVDELQPNMTGETCSGAKPDDEGRDPSLPSRKRSAGSAGYDEAENGRLKSKRLRNRESNADATLQEEETANALARYYDDQLRDIASADQSLFNTVASLLSKLEVHELGSIEDVRQDARASIMDDPEEHGISADAINMNDLRSALMSWSDEKANAAIYGHGGNSFGGEKAGLTLFLEHSKAVTPKSDSIAPFPSSKGLSQFVDRCNEGWYGAQQIALDWLEALIRPKVLTTSADGNFNIESSSYNTTLWPEDLKLTVVQLIVRIDEYIYQVMQQRFDALAVRMLSIDEAFATTYTVEDVADTDMAQTLYELHLDVYSRITNPSSQVDNATRILQHDRLQRWSDLAGSFVNIYADHADDVPIHQWHVIRFIWAATTHANMADNKSQEHTTLCLQDLRELMSLAGNPTITLPNNAALPELSVSAVEQEISRISTLDFFMSIFNDDSRDPVNIIESLEPILELGDQHNTMRHIGEQDSGHSPSISAQTLQLIDFLDSGDASLKLFLWRRLRDAYSAIDYAPKVISCYLRSIEAIVWELSSSRHLRLAAQTRQVALLKWIRELDDMIAKVLREILAEPIAFEIVDECHLKTSISTTARLSRIIHSVALYEDSVRVGQLPEPKGKNASGTKSLDKFRDRLRDIHVRIWTLQYYLIRESIAQSSGCFESPADDLAGYLGSLHNALGLRGYCKYSNKIFLKLLKSELMTMDTKEDYSAEMAQVLFDLHQLKFAPGIGDLNHDCPSEPLDRKSAAHILETVVSQAQRMNIKDLLKSELKSTIEKIQQALGAPKSAQALSYNRRIINAYLKSPVNQLQLFRASRGEIDLPVRVVQAESAKIAAHGWYFLLGHLSLAKFKSLKRTNPGPTDDLDIAITFFKQDLEHNIEKWETWFRLAQVHDAKIEEDLLWTAERVNSQRAELANLQRNAIHCYEMAMAMSVRSADDTTETAKAISQLYTGFATRLYASSREPLSMDAFDTTYHQRHFSSSTEQSSLFEAPSIPPMRMFSVWRFSAHLFRRALAERPSNWINHYMLGKCLWKMLTNPEPGSRRKVLVEEVLDAFTDAIETLPERKDSRADHILEPHFKLVSVVHKLVHRKMLTPSQGSQALRATLWARNVHLAEEEDSWEPYVLEILKKVGHADKSNWHHRIIARAAHVIYDDQQNIAGALGAKHEFTQQIFTKTMTLQVWKPEYERAGRHFVYTSRYVLFFVGLLSQLNDRASLDQLVRRIRRKPGDYLNHQQVWEQVITSYVGLLRRAIKVSNGYEEGVFRTMDHEEFLANAGKLELYAHNPQTSDLGLDILRDAIELKKLNNSLLKGSLIDDLIVDCYASVYQTFIATQPEVELKQALDSESKGVQSGIIQDDGNRERMKLGSILTAQADGNTESPGQVATPSLHMTLPVLSTVAQSANPTPPARPGRPKTVTRREVQRRAEGLVARPPPIKTTTVSKHGEIPHPPVSNNAPRLSSKHIRARSTEDAQTALGLGLGLVPVEGSRTAYLIRKDAEDGFGSTESSRPGSVHDSADNESELSELEEEVEDGLEEDAIDEGREEIPQSTPNRRILFPGLVQRSSDVNDDSVDSSVVISDSESMRNGQGRMDVDEKSDQGDDESKNDAIDVVGQNNVNV